VRTARSRRPSALVIVIVVVAALSALAASCASKPSRFYTLESTATGGDVPDVKP